MNRRDWLKRTSLALAGGLVLGDAAMEAYERLTHRKVFALGGVPDYETVYVDGRRVDVFRSRKVPSGRLYVTGDLFRRMRTDKRLEDVVEQIHNTPRFITVVGPHPLKWIDYHETVQPHDAVRSYLQILGATT